MTKQTYSGVQNQVLNSPKPPATSPSNPHAINVAIAAVTPKK